jgi:hypothetical protein
MTVGPPPQKRDLVLPGEPWRHVLIFIGVAIALFLMSIALFHILERTL